MSTPTAPQPLVVNGGPGRGQPMVGSRNGARQRAERRPGLALSLAYVGVLMIAWNEVRLGEWTVSDLLFVVTAAAIMTQLLTGRTRGLADATQRRSTTLTLVGSLIMLSAGTLTSFWSADPFTSMSVVLRFGWLSLAWFWILRSVTPDRWALDQLITVVRIAALISGVVAILGAVGVIPDIHNTSGRQSAFFSHSNALAGFLVMSLPFFLLGVPNTWRRRSQSVFRTRLLPSGIVVSAIATTGSMTATISSVVGAMTIWLLLLTRAPGRRRRPRHPLQILAIGAASLVGLFALSQSGAQVFERFDELSEGDVSVRGSASFREEGASFVVERFDESLVLGVGFDRESAGEELGITNKAYAAGGSNIHNMLLKMFYEGGSFTVLGLLIIVLVAFQQGWRIIGNTQGDTLQLVAVALLASMVSLSVLAQFQPMGFERFYWLPIALLGVLWSVRRRELRELRSGSETSVDGNGNGAASRLEPSRSS